MREGRCGEIGAFSDIGPVKRGATLKDNFRLEISEVSDITHSVAKVSADEYRNPRIVGG